MNTTTYDTTKHDCAEDNARKFWNWIQTRGGLAIWRSADLSNPGAGWTTPATTAEGQPMTKPTWQADATPERIITSADEVQVCVDKEVKRFRVGIRAGSQGLSLKVTDGGTRRIRAAVAAAGEGAYYQFDYDTQEAVIFKPDQVVSLTNWIAAHPQ